MSTKRIIYDSEFDRIIIYSRSNARNITMRVKPDGLYVTVPPYTKSAAIQKAIAQYRVVLRESYNKIHRQQQITPDFRIDAECFKLKLAERNSKNFTLHYGASEVTLYYPYGCDFSSKEVQATIKNGIVRALKHNAMQLLPPVLELLAQRFNMKYRKVKVNGARKRWGSCSAAGTINLSCYLILLPPHLSDYVMLHELAHTVEMNHGERFWKLLDDMTDGNALRLRKELRDFNLPI